MQAFLEGALAGYGIAVPIGAVSILIFTTGMNSGFRTGFAAGAGAATADLIYATAASVAGAVLAGALQPIARSFRIGGGAVLVLIAAWGVLRLLRARGSVEAAPTRAGSPGASYLTVLGITLVNPLTVVCFAALMLGAGPTGIRGPGDRLLFVAGAALASLSWQSFTAGLGSVLHGRLPARLRVGAVLAGNCIVAGLGARMLVTALV